MHFRPFVILSLLLVIGIGVFFILLRSNGKSLINSASNTTYKAKETVESEAKADLTLIDNANKQKGVRFNYTPEKPVNGNLKGVVEIGATGFNSFIINIDKEKRWEIIAKDFGVSLVYDGLATTEDIQSGINKYISKMFDNAVSKNDLHFVISSGAQKAPKAKSIFTELQKKGYTINLITPEQETEYGLLAAIPPSFLAKSFMVDIGSGNTKIAWPEGINRRTLEAAGSKYYETNLADSTVYNDVKQMISRIPIRQRRVCFILGGIAYLMANQHRAGEERYTELYEPVEYKAKSQRVASGLNIYKAIADGSRCDMFVFDWDASFSIGYLLSLQ